METLLYEVKNSVAYLTLNRPEIKNAANSVMWRELGEAFVRFSATSEERVLVISGAGDAFCSGADLGDVSRLQQAPLDRMRSISEIALRLHRLTKPTIAKVNGVAAGAGCNLALGCDLIVASDTARFSEIFSRRALSVDFGGSFLLPRLIGLHKAKELVYFGDVISASEALSFGLVNKVVEAAVLDSEVEVWAEKLAAAAPVALSLSKLLLNDSYSLSMEEALEREAQAQALNLRSRDAAEALAAFKDKRPAVFQGD